MGNGCKIKEVFIIINYDNVEINTKTNRKGPPGADKSITKYNKKRTPYK